MRAFIPIVIVIVIVIMSHFYTSRRCFVSAKNAVDFFSLALYNVVPLFYF